MTTVMFTSNFNIINNGIIMYYLGYNSKCTPNTTTILGNKTTTYIFPNVPVNSILRIHADLR